MSLGNHELDYGISHMMLVDRVADFPIVNANFKPKNNGTHLFKPYHGIRFDDFNVLFIGLLTANIVDQTQAEGLAGTYVTVADCCEEIRSIVERVRRKDKKVDYTVLLTHIGYEEDLELAAELDPDLGIDIIVGAHSHTYPDECKVVNDILVVQAGMENTHIGRLDLELETDTKKIENWKWEMIPIDEDHCPTDPMLRAMVNTYVLDIDQKYSRLITRFARKIDNFGRGNINELGQIFTDAFQASLPVDFFMLASSSTRCYSMEMTVILQEFYMRNCEIGLGMKLDELQKYGEAIVISSDAFATLRDYLSEHEGLGGPVDDRLEIV